jgi:hypothetical protein
MDKTKTDYAVMMQKIKKYVESNFENPRASMPKIAEGLIELEARQTENFSRYAGLEKRVEDMENKTTDQAINGIKKSLTKIYGKIAFNAFLDYLKTPEGKELLKCVFEGNKEVLTAEIAKIATEKGGLVSTIGGKLRKNFFTAAGIEAVVVGIIVTAGVMYVANRTPIGKYLVEEHKADSIKREFNLYKLEQGKSSKLEMEKISESTSKEISQIKSQLDVATKEMETTKKDYESQLSSIKSSIDSYSKVNDENIKKIEDLEKSRDEEKKKREDLEKKIKEVENKNRGFIKSLNPLK